MEPPFLKLVMLKGPRQGESLEFPPGSDIRIGRVVRGNTLPIKDTGISSKHLSIQTESGKWVLRDLDSSNGTVFDGSNIPPHTPFYLHDGATIKIGELTSIHVILLDHQELYPSMRGRTGPQVDAVEPGPMGESSDAPVPKPARGRGKGLKRKVQIQSIDENVSVNVGNESGYVDRPANTRATRNSKNKVAASDSKVEVPKNTRVTRNSKNKQSVVQISDSDTPVEEPKNTRVTRNSKNKQSVVQISDSDAPVEELKNKLRTRHSEKKQSALEVYDSDAPLEEPKNKRVTRNSKKQSSPNNSSLECRVENAEAKKTRVGTNRRKLQEESAELEEAKVDDGGVKDGDEDGNGKEKENLNGDTNCPDLEKLSLGEWFDFLEVHLPKQIVDATEEIIDSMRQNAEKLREYIIMHKNDKTETKCS
ncbi:FHA domain-containing protein At4g14490 [Gastrolobium bilobum]|uniref:FHA domain-containing protein At4g14490 n=1 Tax=Gastrolobium bilobum TaxID=150636 RepID=UPI002AB2F6DA|nr:FHA domain-containing protein At4g14490 [Gastrolobium bilobum]